MAPTTNDVRDALAHLDTVEFTNSDLAGGIRVALSEEEAGQFFKTVRVSGFNANTKRLCGSLVSHIEAEEPVGLGDMFR